ncbi:sulfatase-like hydrolase/transferase [Anaerocolumna sedimenticola]|uniref:Sulfatase-like hydrolase/transferase n=1 Tax=Anaerocolumna sedimenticola TaxID=2696063 RepID=A0A6P1TLQ9_9FIRM|nr:LTA synthase family protein [Anaerocolumna sedimenticola]QHQ61062.1 sulfatase-like hydrolase/transferase [Anaerocolumna sedimenticola]
MPSDFFSIKTALSVSDNYKFNLNKQILVSTILLFFLIMFIIKVPLYFNKKIKIINISKYICLYMISLFFIMFIFFKTNFTSKYININLDLYQSQNTYNETGTLLGFMLNLKAAQISRPTNYSLSNIKDELSNYNNKSKGRNLKPNIIVIMNEAFSDLQVINKFKTSEDYLPFFRSLTENTIRGNLYVSVYGGSTANTEYEFLSGNSISFLPYGSVPYQQYMKGNIDSLCTILKHQGYTNIAIHPYFSTGYRRNIVYPFIGFDKFITIEDFENPSLIRNYISDKESFKKIIEKFKSKKSNEKLFIFNVTMQNHGGYGNYDFEHTIKLLDKDNFSDVEEYLTLIKESDNAFKYLINYFSGQKEPTIILMFGDHQPRLNDKFYEYLYNKKLTDLTLAEMQKRYIVPFVIWANYDINEENVNKISANYLSSYLLKTIGFDLPAYNQYLLQLYNKIPVINTLGFIDSNGNDYYNGQDSFYKDNIETYNSIEYNNIFDKKHRFDWAFKLN